ncbi:hypothetical protein J6590_029797 [Homalodisca vitripennis]|nr:hypothetical protein J6590_029797 [Homalodisca vitripennis]
MTNSTDIVDCKLKLILGLIWTLILHYSISMPMWEGEDDTQHGEKGATPKQRTLVLLRFIMVRYHKVEERTGDLRNRTLGVSWEPYREWGVALMTYLKWGIRNYGN